MVVDVAPGTMTAEEIVAACRRYTLYEWSAQNAVDPIPVDHAEGVYFYTPDGKRFLDFNSQLMSVNIGHGDKRVIDAIKRPGGQAGLREPLHGHRASRSARREAGRARARRHRRLLLHQRRRRGERERDQAGAPAHRPPEDPDALSLVSRRDRPGHHHDRRSAPLGRRERRVGRGPRARLASLGPQGSRARRGEPARPRGSDHVRGTADDRGLHPRAGRRHQRHPDPARRLPPGRARHLRQVRHPADRRRGHVRLRAHRPLVRGRPLGRRARPHHAWPRASPRATCRSAPLACAAGSPTRSRTRCSTAA